MRSSTIQLGVGNIELQRGAHALYLFRKPVHATSNLSEVIKAVRGRQANLQGKNAYWEDYLTKLEAK